MCLDNKVSIASGGLRRGLHCPCTNSYTSQPYGDYGHDRTHLHTDAGVSYRVYAYTGTYCSLADTHGIVYVATYAFSYTDARVSYRVYAYTGTYCSLADTHGIVHAATYAFSHTDAGVSYRVYAYTGAYCSLADTHGIVHAATYAFSHTDAYGYPRSLPRTFV